MSRSYPIWNDVTACIYQSGKSYGARDNSAVVVKVGSSQKNSHNFVSHETVRSAYNTDAGRVVCFQFFVCGALIKEVKFKAGRNDAPGEMISEKCAYVGRVIHKRVKQKAAY
jgi:hypothetical protein